MTIRYEFGGWVRLEREAVIYRYEDGLLVGRYKGFVDWRAHTMRVYPDKVLCRGWRFDGIKVIPIEKIEGMHK